MSIALSDLLSRGLISHSNNLITRHAELADEGNQSFSLSTFVRSFEGEYNTDRSLTIEQFPEAVRYYNTAIRIANVLESLNTQVEGNLILFNNRARCYMNVRCNLLRLTILLNSHA